jgi:hypothetical protein
VRALIVAGVVLGLVAAQAACHDTEADQLTRVKERVCACKDVACAETAMKDIPSGDVKANHRAQSIARDMLDCYAKLTAAQRPSTDPDAPGSAAP